ncbi:MAG: hypothetical protein C5B48_11255 [Candidatus Rokuibacteriota bacterium]|nr:MAG: hypothetical protein C5B48_11255 [Candidatus Rokubacteria bacterium]
MLEFRLLGPLEVREGDRSLPVPRQKQRALLAALLLQAGKPVSKERLVEDLWGADPPRKAKGALENYVSQLRKLLGKDVLATKPAGYMLAVEPTQVDVFRFERLLGESRGVAVEERAAMLGEALSLFRGPPLVDLVYEPFADVEISRIEELELTAREDLLDAELELGLHAEVVSELESLVARHPYREHLRAQLMLALYRSGRQADALAAYQKARETLVQELGLEPGEELQQLERAILRRDEALRAPPRSGAERPRPTRAAPRAARKTVSVLCAQLVGASELAENSDPEIVQALLVRFASTARAAVERHGGAVETTPGGFLNAVFGVPTAHEDDALRGLRAASDLRDSDLELRIGVATGEVLVGGSVGGRIATGAAVELADRLAGAARSGEIRLDEATWELTREAIAVEPVGEGQHRLVELLPRSGGRALRLNSPLVGRRRSLKALRSSFEDAVVDRSCHLFTVLGTPGVGKSRLAAELVSSVRETAEIALGHCLPYGEGVTYRPLSEALGLAHEDDVPAKAQQALESLVAEKPLIVILDDIQWAEPALLDLVEHLVGRLRAAPVLIVCLARPEVLDSRPTWGGGIANSSTILLEPLADEESEELIDNLLGDSDLPEPVRRHLVRSSGGNPLFVEELLASLVDRDVLRHQAGRWTTAELPAMTVPPSLRALIASRIDLLPDDERDMLELASVEGRQFQATTVEALAGGRDVVVPLEALVRRELVRPETGAGGTYVFRHQLVCDAAYESIPKQTRAEVHERLSKWVGEPAATYHREQAARYRTELGL